MEGGAQAAASHLGCAQLGRHDAAQPGARAHLQHLQAAHQPWPLRQHAARQTWTITCSDSLPHCAGSLLPLLACGWGSSHALSTTGQMQNRPWDESHLERERDMAHMRVPTPSARLPSRRRTAAAPKRSSCTCSQHHTCALQLPPGHPADRLTMTSQTRHQGATLCGCSLHAIPTSCAPCQPMPEHAAGLTESMFAGVSNGYTWHAAPSKLGQECAESQVG